MNLCLVGSGESCHKLFCQIKIKDAFTEGRSKPADLSGGQFSRG